MKKLTISFLTVLFLMFGSGGYSQMITNDPIHTAITTLIKMFQDPSFKTIVQNIEKLKKVTSAVRQYHRGTEILDLAGAITTKLTRYSSAIAKDGHIYPVEYKLMSEDIQKFVEEANKIVKDMKAATTATGGVLQMTDAERAKWLEETYMKIASFDAKITRYFNNIQSVSIRRSANKADLTATAKLYEIAGTLPDGYFGSGESAFIRKDGYEQTYNDSLQIPLDYLYETQAYKDFQKKMRECEFKNQMFYRRQELAAKNMEVVALHRLLQEGYVMQAKKTFLQSQANAQMQLNTYMAASAMDTINIVTTGQSSGGGTIDVQNFIEDEILAIYDPSGNRISPDLFQLYIEHRAKELYLEYGIDQQLEKELGIEECRNLAADFDNVMKAAEQEYLRNL